MRALLGYLFAFAWVVAPAQATTITQTFTNSKAVSLSNLSSGGSYSLSDDSFFNATFLPLVLPNGDGGIPPGAHLTANFVFQGVATSQFGYGGGMVGITAPAGSAYVNGALAGTFPEVSNIFEIRYAQAFDSPVMADVDGSQYFDTSFAFGGASSLAVAVRGSSPFSLTYSSGPGGILALFFGADGTGALTGTLTETQTLTYEFQGDGALLATDVPEPATAALVGAGLLVALGRRRRA